MSMSIRVGVVASAVAGHGRGLGTPPPSGRVAGEPTTTAGLALGAPAGAPNIGSVGGRRLGVVGAAAVPGGLALALAAGRCNCVGAGAGADFDPAGAADAAACAPVLACATIGAAAAGGGGDG